VTSNARKRIEALEKLRADRLAEQARRSSAAERFARKLEKMTAVERAEIEAIQSHWENMADPQSAAPYKIHQYRNSDPLFITAGADGGSNPSRVLKD
jgi:hypothetical protein